MAATPRRKRSDQRQPTLWSAKSQRCEQKLWCGPVAVAATIRVDVAAISDVINGHRNGKSVKRTYPEELPLAFRDFGYQMTLSADLRNNPPTLATWERARTDMDAAYVVLHRSLGSGSGEVVLRYVHPRCTGQD
jgi:hypothetical protein